MADPNLWYTTFAQANRPGSPAAAMQPGRAYQRPMQEAGVFVTPNVEGGSEETVPATPFQRPNRYLAGLAQNMMAQGSSAAPVRSPLEGLARALTGVAGGYFAGQAREQEDAFRDAKSARLAELLGMSPEEAQGLSSEEMIAVKGVMTPKEGETWRPLTPSEAATYGVPQGEVWQISSTNKLRKPGAAGTTIQLPGEPREKFSDALSKVDAQRYEAWANEADTAAAQVGSIRRARDLLDEGLRTGRVTALTAPFGDFMAGFGIDPEAYGLQDASNVAEFTAIANRMTTDLTSQLKGALSDRELRFLERANISIANTPDANRAIMDMLEKGADRKILRLESADEWLAQYGDLRTKNEEGLTFQQAWNRYLKDNETIPESPSEGGTEVEVETVEAGMGPGEAVVTVENVREMPTSELNKLDMDTLSDEALDAVIERLSSGK